MTKAYRNASAKSNPRKIALKTRSKLEDSLVAQLEEADVPFKYEEGYIEYIKKPAKYKPDFILPNGIIIEAKGYFLPEDRTKHLLIKSQRPDLDIRFVFSRSATKLNKNSKTTYGQWCEKHGFQYADKAIPDGWLSD